MSEYCPKCGWSDTRRVKTGSFAARLVKVLGFRQYRCRGCKLTFYRRNVSLTDAELNAGAGTRSSSVSS
jgi:transposase-like protein